MIDQQARISDVEQSEKALTESLDSMRMALMDEQTKRSEYELELGTLKDRIEQLDGVFVFHSVLLPHSVI